MSFRRRKTGETTWAIVEVEENDCPSSGSKCSVTDAPTDPALEGGKMYYYRLRVATTPTTVLDHLRNQELLGRFQREDAEVVT